MNDFCPFHNLENPAFSGFFDSGGGSDSNAQAVLEASVVNNLSLPVVYGVFPLAIKINYMSEHTQGNPGFFSWRAQSFASYSGLIQNMDLQVPRSSFLVVTYESFLIKFLLIRSFYALPPVIYHKWLPWSYGCIQYLPGTVTDTKSL